MEEGRTIRLLINLYGCKMSDITEEKLKLAPNSGESMENPKESMEELLLCRSCIDRAAVGIFRSDEKGVITYVNEYGCASLGYTKEELLGKRLYDIDPAISRDKMLHLKKILDANGVVTHETVHRRRDGTTFPVEIRANQLEFQGKPYVISFVTDITERKRAEEERRKSEEKFSIVFQASPDLIAITRAADGAILEVNEAFTRL